MPADDVFAFLVLIVALSAYVAVIRLRIADRLSDSKAHRAKLNRFVSLSTLADVPMIAAGALLGVSAFWGSLYGGTPPQSVRTGSICLFVFSGVALICRQSYARYHSISDGPTAQRR